MKEQTNADIHIYALFFNKYEVAHLKLVHFLNLTMAILSKFLATGYKYIANRQCLPGIGTVKRYFLDHQQVTSFILHTQLLFWKCSDACCETGHDASSSELTNDSTLITFCKASNVIHCMS